jgi:hypothetical protein
MVNGLVPPYLSAIVPCNFENIHDYNTRQAVSIPPVRTMQFVISCEGFVQFEFLSNNK